jgi:nucleoid-associated protein YgaU
MEATEKPIRLHESNLYAGGSLIIFEDGRRILETKERETTKNLKFQTHLVVAGDELTVLADKYYGSLVTKAKNYWHIIADANNFEKPWQISEFIGTEIIIPDILQWKLG